MTSRASWIASSAGRRAGELLPWWRGSEPGAFLNDAPTGVVGSTCFRQIEYAGVLRGTKHPDEAAQLTAFLLSEPFQKELPLTLFVYPANTSVALPEVFTKFAVVPANPFTFNPEKIAANRQQWQDQWTEIVLR